MGPKKLTVLYNDGYARGVLGEKSIRGRSEKPALKVWREIWGDIGPRRRKGARRPWEASWDETLPLILEGRGFPEESYHTFSYSPLVGSGDHIEGVLCVAMADTLRVFRERQLAALTALAGALGNAHTKQEVFGAIGRGLANQKDIPFALVYLFDEGISELRLVASSGIGANHPAASPELSADTETGPWPIDVLMAENRAVTVEDLAGHFPDLPTGVWDKPPRQARLVPISRRGQEMPAGVFIAALNPYRQFDSSYEGFLDLAAGQIAASITNAEAYRARQFAWEVLEHIPDSFGMLDRSFRVTYMNPAAVRLSSPRTTWPHIGQVLWDLYPILIGTQLESVIRRAMEERVLGDIEQFFQLDAIETWFRFYVLSPAR